MALDGTFYFIGLQTFAAGIFYWTVLCSTVTWAFNIEDRSPIIKHGPSGSLFGFSIAQHHISLGSTSPSNAILLVGAPTDDRAPEHNIDLKRPGGFYRCEVSMEESCERIIVTPRASALRTNSSDQWLGVSVKSQKPGGKIVVCAHRFTLRESGTPSWEAVIGRCFMLESDTNPVRDASSFEYKPCEGKTDPGGIYTQEYFGYCQAGTAVSFAEDTLHGESRGFVVFGAPGSFMWTGTVSDTRLDEVFDPSDVFLDSQTWSQEDQRSQDKALFLKNNLLGSSLTAGKLLNDSVNYISGAPGVNLTGAVAIFERVGSGLERRLDVVEVLYGDRVASRFGHEVVLVDVTGDGRLDLIVGAPQYYDREKKLGGAVYIFVNKGHGQIGPIASQKIFGPPDSGFGMSIASLGDINLDGAQDIAIGAPGENSWRGALYIYHGDNGDNTKGVHGMPSQVIRAHDIISSGFITRNITGMGYSISGGLDMDFNGYPDVAVGTLSDSAIIFQARPIVNIIGKIETPRKKIELPDGVDNKKQECDITFCLSYTSPTKSFDEEVQVTSTMELDTDRLQSGLIPRASFSSKPPIVSSKTINVTLNPQSMNKVKCKTLKTFINDEVQDKLSPIKLKLSFTTLNKPPNRRRRQVKIAVPTPVMNSAIENVTTGEIQFAKECGGDEICESKISMTAFYQIKKESAWNNLGVMENGTLPVLKLGTEKQIGMVIDVNNNNGEDAHQARLKIELPHVLHLRGSDVLEGSGSELHCANAENNHSVVLCTLGNPFKSNSTLKFRLKLSKQQSIYNSSQFQVNLQLLTTSLQPGHDEVRAYPVVVRVEAQLAVTGYPSKEQVKFGGVVVGESAVETPTDAGTLLSHHYEVSNTGTGPAENVILKIQWPQRIENGKWLFYLLEATVQDAKGNCVLPDSVNPLGLKLLETRRIRATGEESNVIEPVLKKSTKSPESSYKALDCESLSCIEFECLLGTISTTDSTRYIDLRAVLWNSTFLEEYEGYSQVQIQSHAIVSIAQKNIEFSEKSRLDVAVSTGVLSEVPVPPIQEVSWLIIVAASIAGVVLLVCLILLLWKCGFFKRQKFGDYQKARRHKQASQKADEREMLY